MINILKSNFIEHADVFADAPQQISGEQNLEYYTLFQRYLKLYENTLQDYIESLDVSAMEFFKELSAVKNDPEIKDKKLLHFVNYVVASTDYESFYKVMVRAAKKVNAKAESKSEAKESSPSRDSKGTSAGSKSDYK